VTPHSSNQTNTRQINTLKSEQEGVRHVLDTLRFFVRWIGTTAVDEESQGAQHASVIFVLIYFFSFSFSYSFASYQTC